MKSRRRIAFPRAKERVYLGLQDTRSNQEIATGGMGIVGQFAQDLTGVMRPVEYRVWQAP
jgi:hypothetical protein